MPLSRYQIRNEYSLADPELYRAADKDDPEALLEGVAMAGLVGVLRQLGDLAEFAADVFHNLHEEVMATATRGHALMVRVQQLETEFPLIEKEFLSQTSHSTFFYNTGVDWHPNLHMDQNLITREDLPRFIMDSYEECRGPPRLFLLDKFDVAGAGACLKRYTDPSFFKVEVSSQMAKTEIHRDKKTRKVKKKGSRWRNGETPDVLPASHAKLHQLFLEERVENGIGDPVRRVKLKRRLNGFPFESKSGRSYMEKFLKTPSPEHKIVQEISTGSSPLRLPSNICIDSRAEVHEIGMVSSDKQSVERNRSSCSSPDSGRTLQKSPFDELPENSVDERISTEKTSQTVISTGAKPNYYFEPNDTLSPFHKLENEKEIMVDEESKAEGSGGGYLSDDIASEVDNYMDALTTMESEMETDTEFRMKSDHGCLNIDKQVTDSDVTEEELREQFSDSQSVADSTASDDGNGSFTKGLSSFSYSDTPRIMNENLPLDGDTLDTVVKSTASDDGDGYFRGPDLAGNVSSDGVISDIFPCEICKAEIINVSSDDISTMQEITASQPLEDVVCCRATIEAGENSSLSEFGEPHTNLSQLNSTPMLLPAEPGVLRCDTLEGAGADGETEAASSSHEKDDYGVLDCEENDTNPGDNSPCSTSNLSDVPSQKSHDFPATESAENHHVHGLYEELNVLSNSLVCFPDVKADPGSESCELPLKEVLQTEYSEDSSIQDLVYSQITLPNSVISQVEEQPLHLHSSNFETCNTGGLVSDSVDAILLVGGVSVKFNSEDDDSCNTTDQQVSKILDVSAASVTSDSGDKHIDGVQCGEDGNKICENDTNFDFLKTDTAVLDFSSDWSNSLDPSSLTEGNGLLNEIKTETAQSEALVVAGVAIGDHHATEDNGSSPSSNPGKLRQISVSSIIDVDYNELKSKELSLLGYHEELGTQEEVKETAVSSTGSALIMCEHHFDNFQSHPIESLPDSSLLSEAKNSLDVRDAILLPSELESGPPGCIHVTDNIVDTSASKLSDSPEYQEEARDGVHLFSDTLVPISSEYQESESSHGSILNEKTDNGPSLPAHHSSDVILLEKPVSLQANELGEEPLHVVEATPKLFPLLEMMKSENHVDCEIPFGASILSFPEENPNSLLESVPLPTMAPLDSIFPGFAMLPETTDIRFADMPPLPPLPPVEWRMGKLQQTSITSKRDLVCHTVDFLPSISTIAADRKVQLGYTAEEGKNDQLLDSFLLPPVVKYENSLHVYEDIANSALHSNQLSCQTSTNVNNESTLDVVVPSERIQSMSLTVALPAMQSEMPQLGSHEDEEGRKQPYLSPFSPMTGNRDTDLMLASGSCSSHGTSIESLHQVAAETSLEDRRFDHCPGNLDGEVADSRKTDFRLPIAEDRQPQHAISSLEGDIAQPTVEDGKLILNQPMKLPRPRSPLIDAVAAHDKSKLRKVTERVRPQAQKAEERDSLLEQIRTKSFSLKPAAITRPSIQGPKTNLKVAAILEKANAIRQALAGSDEDDDADSWSDS